MSRYYQPTAERLRRAHIALENAQNDESLEGPLAAFGYTDERLRKGQDLVAEARRAQESFIEEYGEQYEATDAYLDAREEAEKTYMRHLKVARVAFDEDRPARSTLRLDGRRKKVLGKWLRQTRLFYRNALNDTDYQAALSEYNITEDDLRAGLEKIDAVEAADVRQEKEKSEAQAATDERDEAIDALDAYMSKFREIVRVAFEDDPQQLEKFTITAPSA